MNPSVLIETKEPPETVAFLIGLDFLLKTYHRQQALMSY